MRSDNIDLPTSNHFKLNQLAEGIYAAIATDEGMAICNSGIVDLGESVVIFDSFLTPQAARDLRVIVEQLTDNPIRYLINSHYHNDHIRGNQVFSTASIIIATNHCRKLIQTKGIEEIKWDKENSQKQLENLTAQIRSEKNSQKRHEIQLWITYYRGILESLPELRLVVPNLSFDKRLFLSGSQRTVEIINTEQGHTDSDAIMYISNEEILFASDLVFVNYHPYLASGTPNKWLKTLNNLKNFKISTLVPGHGPIGTVKDIELMIQYITTLANIASNIIDEQDPTQQEMMSRIPPPFDSWRFGDFFFETNLQFLREHLVKNSLD